MKTQRFFPRIATVVLVFCLTVCCQATLFGQVAVSANVSNTQPKANDTVTVSLGIAENIDFYYGGVETAFDTSILQFLSEDTAALSYEGVSFSGELTPGVTGASVSRSTALDNPSSGTYMELHFLVKSSAVTGTTSISFSNQEISDSNGDEISTSPIPGIDLDIQPGIGVLDLTIPSNHIVTEGNRFDATAQLFASGITDTSLISMWVGIDTFNTDPDTWDNSIWQKMEHHETGPSNYLYYTREIVYSEKRAVDSYYVALRAQLDNGAYVYGGTEGLWNASTSGNALLSVTQQPPFRYTVVKWNFDEETLSPSLFTPGNEDAHITLTGASFEGYASGASGQAANSNDWTGGADKSRYWSTSFTTEGFSGLQLASKQYGSGTGPRDFAIEASTDDASWSEIAGSDIRVATSWSAGALDSLSLPSTLDDREQIHIRWVMTSDTNINNEENIGSSGTNRLDDVRVTGINPSSSRLEIYPGDANNDGLVNAADVLPLGTYWLSSGPLPIYPGLAFAPREVETWIPPRATYADTRGDGRIDHTDLMPIGLHFGKAVSTSRKQHTSALTEMVIEPQTKGKVVSLILETESPVQLRGMAFSLNVSGISPEDWEVKKVTPVFCPDEWNGNLLSFDIKRENLFEAASVLKGQGDITQSRKMAAIELSAVNEWPAPVTLSINRVTVSNTQTANQPVYLPRLSETDSSAGTIHYETRLFQNQPNPYRYKTIIPYELSEKMHVEIKILNLQGELIDVLVDRMQDAGSYSVEFDASGLTSGVYLFRLKTKRTVRCKKMIIAK